MYHGRPLTLTGLYRDTTRSVHGCDSIIDSLSLYVHEFVRVQMAEKDSICNDAGVWNIPFRIVQGRSCDSYSLSWDEPVTGLPTANKDPLPADSIFRLAIPAGFYPAYYHAHFVFHDTLKYLSPQIEDAKADVRLAVLYPDVVIIQRWNDVLAVRNADYNGGYQFDSVQWYLGNSPIEGATSFVYYAADAKLRFGEPYRAYLLRNDGVWLFTCPFMPSPVGAEVTDIPTLVPLSSPLHISGRGKATWYDLLGRQYNVENYDNSSIITPSGRGSYLLLLQNDTAERKVYRVMVR